VGLLYPLFPVFSWFQIREMLLPPLPSVVCTPPKSWSFLIGNEGLPRLRLSLPSFLRTEVHRIDEPSHCLWRHCHVTHPTPHAAAGDLILRLTDLSITFPPFQFSPPGWRTDSSNSRNPIHAPPPRDQVDWIFPTGHGPGHPFTFFSSIAPLSSFPSNKKALARS